jgi:4-hydroxybenzoate polyprenyltransferase
MRKLVDLVRGMRPYQWTKNLVTFAGLIFSQRLGDPELSMRAVQAFLVFCMASGVVYLTNDVADLEKDRYHPAKRNRPLPSGRLSVGEVVLTAGLVGAGALGWAWWLGSRFFAVTVVFLGFNLAYSFLFKRVALLDVMSIALSFVIRAIAGVAALEDLDPTIELSPWLLICTLFLALFLGFCKRRYELGALDEAVRHRESLQDYSTGLLDQLVGLSAAGSVIAYAIYTIWPETVAKFHTTRLVYTIPLVVLGVMRYLYLVYRRDEGGCPSELLLTEKFLLGIVVAWISLVLAIFYLMD